MTRLDLAVERRLGETIRIIVPFAIVSLALIPLALGMRVGVLSEIGNAVFWALGLLFGMQVALRRAAHDALEVRDLHALAGVDPAARYAGRVLSGSLLIFVFLAVLFAAMLLLFNPEQGAGEPIGTTLTLALMAVGLAEIGTLAGDIAWGLRDRTALASLIVAPLAIPMVIGGSQTLEALARDTGILPWVLLMLATDLALAVIGVALARPLEEASR